MSSRSAPTTIATGLPPAYDPHVHEPAALEVWEDAGLFHVGPAGDADPYSIVMPPPNVTAGLHLGHALNNTLQDVLIRYHRMRGLSSLWIPGTDHAGIATQTVVEKRLLAQGISRQEMGRQAFVDKTREWKDDYEAVIIDQLKEMGASCDWERVRFTMDQMCATAVRHAFFVLFRDGLIYRGKRLVNWDPASLTALADDEVDMEEVAGHMWYLRYPLADGSGHVTVATTRPETMLGDTAVALNPKDPRAADLEGKEVRLPIVDRVIPIIVDDHVVMADPDSSDPKAAYASGFLKVTPAHDPNDWEIGLRHDLPVVNVLGPDARISDAHGWEDVSEEARPLVGLSREDARQAVVDWFEAYGLLEEVRDYTHSVGHSYRSHVPIEPWLSDQWYVAVTDDRFRGSALRAPAAHQQASPAPAGPDGPRPGDGGLTFFPSRYARTFQAWHENLRDWCISRQLWWGHRIPVWTRIVELADAPPEVAGADLDVEVAVSSRWVEAGAAHLARRITAEEVEEAVCIPPEPTLARLPRADGSLDEQALVRAVEAEGFERDPDVLDTWFSSALWPMSTMGWPWPEDHPETLGLLESYNPTSVLTTAREIITLWVSRMVMFNRYFLDGQLPFHHVFIHAMMQDGHGQKMSKSLGNGVDPRDIIHSHGADAMRFTLVQMTTDTQDVRMPVALIAPQTGETFEPVYESTPAGHIVAAPIQRAPSDPSLGWSAPTARRPAWPSPPPTSRWPATPPPASTWAATSPTRCGTPPASASGGPTATPPPTWWSTSGAGRWPTAGWWPAWPRPWPRSTTPSPPTSSTPTPTCCTTSSGTTCATATSRRSSPPSTTTPSSRWSWRRCSTRCCASCIRCAPSSPRPSGPTCPGSGEARSRGCRCRPHRCSPEPPGQWSTRVSATATRWRWSSEPGSWWASSGASAPTRTCAPSAR